MWTPNRLNIDSGALYQRLSRLIESYIEKGFLVENERLPSERQLATWLEINRSTVVHALESLVDRGVLVRRRGSGTFVNAHRCHLSATSLFRVRNILSATTEYSLYEKKKQYLYQYAKTMNLPVCDLSNGDLPQECLPKMTLSEMDTRKLMEYEQCHYDSLCGLPGLKQHIQQYMWHHFGFNVPLDQILVTSGSQQSLFLISHGLLKPGDAIGIEIPSYFYLLPLFQASGLRLVPLRCDEEGVLLDTLDKAHRKYHLKFIFINPVFQNPTGRTMTIQRKVDLLRYINQERIMLVEDDVYSALYFSKEPDCKPIKKDDVYNRVLYLGSLSKYLGRHMRVGWMIAPSEVVQSLAKMRHSIDSGLSILPQILAEHYLKNDYQEHQQQLRQFFKKKRDALHFWLSTQYPGVFNYVLPKGGNHLYAQINDSNISQTDLLNTWLLQYRFVKLGRDFGSPGYVRLSYGHFQQI